MTIEEQHVYVQVQVQVQVQLFNYMQISHLQIT